MIGPYPVERVSDGCQGSVKSHRLQRSPLPEGRAGLQIAARLRQAVVISGVHIHMATEGGAACRPGGMLQWYSADGLRVSPFQLQRVQCARLHDDDLWR